MSIAFRIYTTCDAVIICSPTTRPQSTRQFRPHTLYMSRCLIDNSESAGCKGGFGFKTESYWVILETLKMVPIAVTHVALTVREGRMT